MEPTYFQEDIISPYKKGYKLKLLIFFVFLLILGLLFYFAFFGEGIPFTGNTIIENASYSRIKFDAELTRVPLLELDGEFKSVRMNGISNSLFYAGDQEVSLVNSSNYIILGDYNGKIYFNEENISKLKGKASIVIINGVSLLPKSGATTKVYFNEGADYTFLELKETVFIKKLSYNTSGEVSLRDRKNIFEIHDEEIMISRFQGDLKVDNGNFNLKGYVERMGLTGQSDISVEV